MVRLAFRALLLILCIGAICATLSAQSQKTITIRMLDSKSGKLIATSDFLVRINHDQTVHGDWVQKNEEGVGVMKLPPDATEILVHATYDGAMSVYDNCDAVKDLGTANMPPLSTTGTRFPTSFPRASLRPMAASARRFRTSCRSSPSRVNLYFSSVTRPHMSS